MKKGCFTQYANSEIAFMKLGMRLLGITLFFSGCFGVSAIDPVRERRNFTISVKPDRNDSELIIAATVENSSTTYPLDLRNARITYIAPNTTELPPLRVDGGCLDRLMMPGKACSFNVRYEIVGTRQFPATWEFSLEGETVQFSIDN
jgi:hypothetical protein